MRVARRQFIRLAAVAPLALALGGCSLTHEKSGPIAERIIDAVATTGMVGDLVLNVGGNRVNVDTLMGPGVDPHLFKASERTLRTMERGDIVLYNGLHLEGGLSFVLEEMGKRQPTVAVAGQIPEDLLRTPPEFQGNPDPHVWFDVSLWSLACQATITGMQELDPTWAETYQTNGDAYLAELAELEEWVFTQVAAVPEERRVLITAHDAFGYFGERYGFEVRGIQGASTATEAGAHDVQALAELIAERRIPGDLRRVVRAAANGRGIAGGRPVARLRCPDRRTALLRRDGQPGHAGRDLPGHDPRQCHHDRQRAPREGGSIVSPDTPAIEVTDMTVAYRDRPVLWDVDLIVPQGVLMAIVGPNGAGKTTMIKAILGLLQPVAGQVRILGKSYRETAIWSDTCRSGAASTGISRRACSTW